MASLAVNTRDDAFGSMYSFGGGISKEKEEKEEEEDQFNDEALNHDYTGFRYAAYHGYQGNGNHGNHANPGVSDERFKRFSVLQNSNLIASQLTQQQYSGKDTRVEQPQVYLPY